MAAQRLVRAPVITGEDLRAGDGGLRRGGRSPARAAVGAGRAGVDQVETQVLGQLPSCTSTRTCTPSESPVK
ncbi:MAG: hypothetical protein M3P96_15740 [Actinomycetota bacterium]|nr:hypothetical protein [Actinomycetota bacterium]